MTEIIDITITKNADACRDLFMEEYENMTADWTDKEREGLPPHKIKWIIRSEDKNGCVDYKCEITR